MKLSIILLCFFVFGVWVGMQHERARTEPCLSPTPIAAWNGQLKAAGYLKYMCSWSGERYYCVMEQDDK